MRHFSKRARRSISSTICIDALEKRQLFSAGEPGVLAPAFPEIIGEPIVIGTNKLIDITFTADNGRKTTIKVHGAQAAITFAGSAVPLLAFGHGYFPNGTVESVTSILLTDAKPGQASISEVCAFGTGYFNVGSITGGDLGSINFPDVNLSGSLSLGSVKSVKIGSVLGASMNITKSVASMKVTGGLTGSLTAGSIGSLTAANLIQENIRTTAVYSRSALQVGSVTAIGGIQQSNIISSGNIGSITTAFITNSVISAGGSLTATGTYPAYDVPESSGVFTVPASIRSIRVLPSATQSTFGNSVIVARTIQNANIGQITGGGGIAAHSIGTFIAQGPTGQLNSVSFHFGPKDLHTSTSVRTALTKLAIPFSQGPGLVDNTMFYGFVLNILR